MPPKKKRTTKRRHRRRPQQGEGFFGDVYDKVKSTARSALNDVKKLHDTIKKSKVISREARKVNPYLADGIDMLGYGRGGQRGGRIGTMYGPPPFVAYGRGGRRGGSLFGSMFSDRID